MCRNLLSASFQKGVSESPFVGGILYSLSLPMKGRDGQGSQVALYCIVFCIRLLVAIDFHPVGSDRIHPNQKSNGSASEASFVELWLDGIDHS